MSVPIEPPDDELLWRRYHSELVRFATVLVGPSDAQDIVADAFLQARTLVVSVAAQNQRAYLYRSVANQAQNYRRSADRRQQRELSALVRFSEQAPEIFCDVRDAVVGLSVQQRAVVYLVYWEDRTVVDTAGLLGISTGSAQKHLKRAQSKLRRAIHG